MATYRYQFLVGQKAGKNLSYFPDYLGSKSSQYTQFTFHNGMWYDPKQYPQLHGKNNTLFGLLYRGGVLTYGANIFYWGWKPSPTKNKFEIYANVCTDVTLPPIVHKMGEVDGNLRERLLLKFTKTEYFGFDMCKYDVNGQPQSVAFWQTSNNTGGSYWFAYRYPPTMELQSGSPIAYQMIITDSVN